MATALALGAGAAVAQTPPTADLTMSKPALERRIALVVGNSAYQSGAKLANPVNDARAMGEKLKKLGFDVIELENGTKQQIERAIGQFSRKLGQDSVSLFYYAGHGMQVNGKNYLIPIDAQIDTEQTVRLETVDVDAVIDQMAVAKSRVNLVILDACRNNPFERRFRSVGGGLASIDAPSGTLIAYATAPGKVAADGESSANGLYTAELLRALDAPGAKVEEVFKKVRISVTEKSKGNQTPWEASSLTGDFYFNTANAVVLAPAQPGAGASADRDVAFWTSVKDSRNPALLGAYLKQFPQGTFAELAKLMIDELQKPPAQVASAAPGASRAEGPTGRATAPQTAAVPPPADVRPKPPRGFPVEAGKTFRDCPECPELVVIPPGNFMMGSPAKEIGRDGDEGPVHRVAIDSALAVGVSHVTRGEFARFAAATKLIDAGGCNMFSASRWERDAGKSWRDPGFAQTDRDPVVCVSWEDAKAYAAWLARETGRDYRLLTEAEWEYAARGGATSVRWWGDSATDQCKYANGADATARQQFVGWTVAECEDGFANTSPAGTYPANGFGLFDMQGNAWQWVEDCGTPDYEGAPRDSAVAKVAIAACTTRTLRGGSWGSFPRNLRVALRGRLDPATRVNVLGFRIARPE